MLWLEINNGEKEGIRTRNKNLKNCKKINGLDLNGGNGIITDCMT
jgi:hypothetical protein